MANLRRIFSEEEVQTILQDYQSGGTRKEIAKALHTSQEKINEVLRSHRIDPRSPGLRWGRRFSEDHVRWIIRSYQEGKSRVHIAATLHSKPETIGKILQAHGIELRPQWEYKFTGKEQKQIAERYAKGDSIESIRKDFHCGDEVIRKIVTRHNIALRPRGGTLRKFSAEELQMIEKMTQEGCSQQQIAMQFETTSLIICRIMKQRGIATRGQMPDYKGSKHHSWKGGRSKNPYGYWIVMIDRSSPFFSMANRAGYVLEHRLVIAESLGRPLTSRETVHHINGDRADNRLENLQLRASHHGQGTARRCANCGSYNIVEERLADTKERED